MKKVILFLSIIGTALLMTSCLGDNETSYSGTSLSYVTTSELGVVYAMTLDRYLPITSPEIRLEQEGSFVYINYSWTESQNTVTEEGIYNATIGGISDPIEQTILRPTDAPERENETPLKSFNAGPYLGPYFGYHWICAYGYEKGDGNKKKLVFYHNIEEGTKNEIIIDVRLEDAVGTVDKDQADIPVAANFKSIHDYYSANLSSSTSSETLRVYFRYYSEKSAGTLELIKTQSYNMEVIKEQ